ncbi:hypothetical protein BWK63_13005 [Flavobacterium covae]|uniref:Uncharacterized protein n=1 Tax=Flavobacterium covae TaxID=2906076 RepID=A0ABW8PJL2_9FLAO|nr:MULTISPECIES: hypothetical protein [Flavobacterium]OWP80062.1 hypothetical protein BWK63_13005 [Flavobacterium covae]POR20661.1 hypothetical protein BWK57_12795 [Flavobacterium columnare]
MTDAIFSKAIAFDELTKIQTIEGEITPTKSAEAILKGCDYLQYIFDTAFAKGFEAGLDANEKINNYASENPNL